MALLQGCSSYSSTSKKTPVTISISPTAASVATGKTQQFTAAVAYATNATVTWQVNGVTGGDSTHGIITASGLYTAPGAVPNPATVTVTAVSQADATKSASATITISAMNVISVSISPTSATLQVRTGTNVFMATVQNDTQSKGVSWSLSGSGCSGTACGTLSNQTTSSVTYTAPASVPNPATVTLTATSNADSTKSAAATITVAAGSTNISVTVSPTRGGLTTSQALSIKATLTNDSTNQGVGWSFTSTGATTGGSFSSNTSASGAAVTFTAPSSAGVVTITAKSVADSSKSATATIGVTDLAGVTTYLNGNARLGANLQEYALTTSGATAVNSTNFGKLFSCTVDAAVYAQPLWVANLSIAGSTHNVVFVATEHDTVYAFDADSNAAPCAPLWKASLIDSAHGGAPGETWGASADPLNCVELAPDIGIVGTPAIDLSTKTLYVVSKTKVSTTYHQRVHALDITTGNEKFSGPVEISAMVAGTGVGGSGGRVPFDPLFNNQRAALLLLNGHVIIAWASHCDYSAYHGWVMSYGASTLAQEAVLNVSPNGINAGIWMSANGPSADASGNIYLATGNGTFDANTGGLEYGDSVLKLGPPGSGTFPVLSYFRPFTLISPDTGPDLDQGSGGVQILPAVGTKNYLLQAGKDGNIYVLDSTSLGGYGGTSNHVVQELAGTLPGGMWGSPTYWNGNVYFGAASFLAASSDPLRAFAFDAVNSATLSASPTSVTAKVWGYPGPTAPVSANGSSNGIVWALDNVLFCTPQSTGCGAAVLHAYEATNLATELWNSAQNAGDTAGNAVKFTVPTVANGKVYVGTRGNNTGGDATSTTIPGELDVYGLKPN